MGPVIVNKLNYMWTRLGKNEQYTADVYSQHVTMADVELYVLGEFMTK